VRMPNGLNRDLAATGMIASLWRYPVKSMTGEELNSLYATERGLTRSRC
jgi:uncharacterized protein YcbX